MIDGVAYIPSANKGMVAFDTENKEILWSFETDDSILFTAPYVGKGAKEMLSVDDVDSKDFLTQLFNAMYDELPEPKKKK